jgi:hypothetical protein
VKKQFVKLWDFYESDVRRRVNQIVYSKTGDFASEKVLTYVLVRHWPQIDLHGRGLTAP